MLVTELVRGKETIRNCNRAARKIGLKENMLLADAQSLVGASCTLVAEPTEPEEDFQALEKLAVACDRFSPCVGIEDLEPPECLLLDITGIAHLFQGEASLARKVTALFSRWKLLAHIGVADSIGAAWAAAHFLARNKQPAILPVGDYSSLMPAPIACLRLNEQTLPLLGKLGILTVGQLLRLERHSLPARFGRELSRRREQFLAQREELITPYRPQLSYEFRRSLENGLTHHEAIESLFASLLQQLMKALRSRSLGTRHIECKIECDDRKQFKISIRLCQLGNSTKHVCELFRLHLERVHLISPVVEMQLQAMQPAPMQWDQLEAFSGDSHVLKKQFSLLLNRVTSRLGENAVVRSQLTHYPLPEMAYRYTTVTDLKILGESLDDRFRLYDRPLCIYDQPKEMQVVSYNTAKEPEAVLIHNSHSSVTHLWGPERIESNWWRGPSVRRDYYRMEICNGSWFWVFQRINDGKWFLHGQF